MIEVRPRTIDDDAAIWHALEPTLRAADTFAFPRDMTRDAALAYWNGAKHETFVAVEDGQVSGSYYLRANQDGGGAHVANAGYVTAPESRGRGIARAMGEHSLARARARGFRAMQFNIVVSENARAVALWTGLGFRKLCALPGAFLMPDGRYVDAFVMFQEL